MVDIHWALISYEVATAMKNNHMYNSYINDMIIREVTMKPNKKLRND